MGMDQQTLERRLVKAGFERPKGKVSFKKIYAAIVGEKPNDRLATAKAVETERENALAAGELHTLANVERILWEELLSPLRNSLLAYPQTTGEKIKAVLQSRGVSDDVSKEVVEIASAGVRDTMKP
jgi:hypothetical protein